jgi:peptidoglycan/LPS O-acetylase OafA/YrhL
LIASFTFGWFFLLPEEYEQLGKHMVGGAGFISNFFLWSESGYFDEAAEFKPLLHLWSLGIEEQFYIIWPLLLFLTFKWRLNPFAVTAIIALSSFVLNIETSTHDAVASFYSPLTRFWELLVGSSLSYVLLFKTHLLPKPHSTVAHILSFAGAAVVGSAAFVIHKELSFPGWWAALPTIATAAIILAGPQTWLNREILSNRLLVSIGLISYPLYLWHWPLLSFPFILEGEAPSRTMRVGAVLASICLAWLTYWLVETRVRNGSYLSAKSVLLCVFMFAVGCAGYASFVFEGFIFRLGERADYYEFFKNTPSERRFSMRPDCSFYHEPRAPLPKISSTCYVRNPTYKKAVFIWGDSYAMALHYGLRQNLPSSWQILQVASFLCIPRLENMEASADDYCVHSNSFALQAIKESIPEVVIIAELHVPDIETLYAIANELKRLGVEKVVIAGSPPSWNGYLPSIVVRNFYSKTPQRTYDGVNMSVIAVNRDLREHFKHDFKQDGQIVFADLIDTFCNTDGCLVFIGNDERNGITTYDWGHLSPAASDYLAKSLLVHLIADDQSVRGPLAGSGLSSH